MKKYFTFIFLGIVGFAGFAIAAPSVIYQTTILPISDSQYDLGTSTDKWRGIYTKDLTVTGTCTGCGGAGSLPFYASTTIGNATQTGGLTISGGATTTLNSYFASNVGIGTNSFNSLFAVSRQSVTQAPVTGSTAQIVGLDANPLRITFDTHNNANTSGTALMFRRSYGTSASPSAVLTDGVLGSLNFRGYGTTGYAAGSTGLMTAKAEAAFTDASMPTALTFDTTPTNSVTAVERLRITGAGSLGLGTTTPFAMFSIHHPALSTNTNIFAIASSTATATTTLFSIDNVGRIKAGVVNNSLYIGNGAGLTDSTGSSNVGVGLNALAAVTTGTELSAFGANSLASATSTSCETAFGSRAMQFFTNPTACAAGVGQSNSAFGMNALRGVLNQSYGIRNAAFGERALFSTTLGSRNMAFGYTALGNNTTGSDNQGIGYQALIANTIGGTNTAIGNLAMSLATSSNGNTCVGYSCMSNFLGTQLGGGQTENNTAVGQSALQGAAAGMTSSQNVAIGQQAVSRLTSGGVNTGVGYRVGLNVSSGSNNVLMGALNANTLTTGSFNTIIGTGFNGTTADVKTAATSNSINFSNIIFADLVSAANGGGNVGIGTTTPFARFSIATEPGANGNLGTLFAIASSTPTATSTLFTVDNAGRTGIGTTSQALNYLTVQNANTSTNIVSFLNSASTAMALLTSTGIFSAVNFDTGGYLRGHNSSSFLLMDQGTGRMNFSTASNGSLGIGLNYATDRTLAIVNPDGSLGGKFGVGTTTPFAKLGIHADNGETNTTLFAIASSTATATTTHFQINNDGTIYAPNTSASGATQTGYWCYDANGQLIRDTVTCLVSARKFKKDIKPLDIGLTELMQVRPVTYYNKDASFGAGQQIGVIADEVAKIDDRLIVRDSSGDIHGFNYEQYTAWITKAVQELNDKVDGKPTILVRAARSAEENWQWFAIALLVCWNLYLTFKRRK